MNNRKRVTIIHLSDLHLRSAPDKGHDFEPGLSSAGLKTQNLVAHINNKYPDAHVAITGDITDSGTDASLREAQRILGEWIVPHRLSVVLGNHDCGTYGNFHLAERVANFRQVFAPTVKGGLTHPWVKWLQPVVLIGLDSNAEGQKVILACGQLGRSQIDWLDRFLAALPAMWIPVLLLHHHPFDRNLTTCLVDAEAFRSCVNTRLRGRPSLVLFGHKHRATKTVRSGPTNFQAPSSTIPDRNRLRFRVLSVGHDGIEDRWDSCKVPAP